MALIERKVTKIGNSFGITLPTDLLKQVGLYHANKRTALASLIVFLKINHFEWTMGIDDEQEFTVDVVNHKYTFEEIVLTIKKIQISYRAIRL